MEKISGILSTLVDDCSEGVAIGVFVNASGYVTINDLETIKIAKAMLNTTRREILKRNVKKK